MIRDTPEVKYLVLVDRAVPFLLARVRWPDVAQAVSEASPIWIDDPGLFDLPYEPSAVAVSYDQAATLAAGWGSRLDALVTADAPSYIRRMPANWSDLSPSERHTWGVDFVGRKRGTSPRLFLHELAARTGGRSSAQATRAGAARRARAIVDRVATNGHGSKHGAAATAAERRSYVRVELAGRAHIRSGHTTLSAGLVDLSERGVRCVLPDARAVVATGATLEGPFLLEAEVGAARICLNVGGAVSWNRTNGNGADFGVAFDELAEGERDGLKLLLRRVA